MPKSIYQKEVIYLPPLEEDSAPLEVALGCSWGQCTFCDFAKDDFILLPRERIQNNILGLARLFPQAETVFLLGGNAFVLAADKLVSIFESVKEAMPRVQRFAMYARSDDVLAKTASQLADLQGRGLAALHVGVESGSDSLLAECRKGLSSQQMLEAFRMLDAAGIAYHVTLIGGLGGRTYSRLHALETSRFLNKTRPASIWCLKLHLFEGTPLHKTWLKGGFDQMTPVEVLAEVRLILSELTVEDCLFEDSTVLNRYTLRGRLPEQKAALLAAMDRLLLAEAAGEGPDICPDI